MVKYCLVILLLMAAGCQQKTVPATYSEKQLPAFNEFVPIKHSGW